MMNQSAAYVLFAPLMLARPYDPAAQVSYELMADAFVWSDELPIEPPDWPIQTSCLRGLLRNRTTLMLAAPDEKFLPA